MTRAVLFDVDFTLIYPGPTFQASGYQEFCRRYGMEVDPGQFSSAVASAGRLLEGPDDIAYDDEIYIGFTRHIIEAMSSGPSRRRPALATALENCSGSTSMP